MPAIKTFLQGLFHKYHLVSPFSMEKRPLVEESFRIKLFNVPKFFTGNEIKEKIATLLADSFSPEADRLAVKKAPTWNYAFVSFSREDHQTSLLQQIEKKEFFLKKNLVRGEKTAAEPEATGSKQHASKKQSSEEASQRTVLDQVTPLHSLPYEEQLLVKRQEIISVCPKEIGALLDGAAVVPSPCVQGYRNKCEFSIGLDSQGKSAVGFMMGLFKDGITLVESAADCPHVPQGHKDIAAALSGFIAKCSEKFPVFDRVRAAGYWRLMIVRSNRKGEHLVAIQIHPQSLSQEEMAYLKRDIVDALVVQNPSLSVCSLQFQVSTAKNHGVNQKEPFEVIHGTDCIYEHLEQDGKEFKFRISVNSFFQVNTMATEVLYSTIARMSKNKSGKPDTKYTLLDLCCGTGTIGIALSSAFDQVIGVEMIPEAVQDANFNATLNNCTNIEFICAKLEECIEKIFATKVDSTHSLVVVLDPPRNGAHPSVVKCLKKAAIAAKIDKIVYVSCSPAQASINFDALMRPAGAKTAQYLPVEAVSLDLFPHTKHCELVVAFERANEEVNE